MSGFEPDTFRPESISPETAKFNEGVQKLLSSSPPTYSRPPEVTRQEREKGKGFIPAAYTPSMPFLWRLPGRPTPGFGTSLREG